MYLQAIAAAAVAGISLRIIIHSLEEVKGVSGRFELVNGGQDYSVIVDYAHTPDSLQNVLKTVRQIAEKRIIVVVGCGGDRDRTKRPIMAQIACKFTTDPVFTSDNPRTEDPGDIKRNGNRRKRRNYTSIPDRKEAIEYAVNRGRRKVMSLSLPEKAMKPIKLLAKKFMILMIASLQNKQ